MAFKSNEFLQTFPKCCEGTHLVIMDCWGELRDPLELKDVDITQFSFS